MCEYIIYNEKYRHSIEDENVNADMIIAIFAFIYFSVFSTNNYSVEL